VALFEELAPLCAGKPKGLTPAYINPDGTREPPSSSCCEGPAPGALTTGGPSEGTGAAVLPLFQMSR
jgi:hypothetical protein